MVRGEIEIPAEAIRRVCERNSIRKLSLFGSILTPRFHPESDIDMLVEFEPGYIPTLPEMAGMEIELTGLLGRKVDLRTAQDLSRHFRERVLLEAVAQYERV